MEIHEDLYWAHGKESARLSITDFYLLHFKLKSKLLPLTAITHDPCSLVQWTETLEFRVFT